jgi:C-terminal processing protease CtpA/Prc
VRLKFKKFFPLFITISAAIILTVSGYFFYANNAAQKIPDADYSWSLEKDKYVRFTMETFDKIKLNYWNNLTDDNLGNLYRLAIEKLTGKTETLATTTKEAVSRLVKDTVSSLPDNPAKKDFALKLTEIVLYNLEPFGRSALYTERQESALRNEVKNVNPGKDLYADLGLPKGSPPEAVQKNYERKVAELDTETPEATAKLKTLAYAKEVLTNPDAKTNYDRGQIEPTVFKRALSSTVYYVYMEKFSPTTFDELVKTITEGAARYPKADSLIFDVRGNIGGAIDWIQYFSGLFIGGGQYAYEFYHQGNFKPFKSLTAALPALSQFKKIIMLIDNRSESSTELLAATIKKYHAAVVVGKRTNGHGTVENTFPLDTEIDPAEKYSLFLVHSLTVGDDGQPIEGRGVLPNVDTEKTGWQKELLEYWNDNALVLTAAKIINRPPLK